MVVIAPHVQHIDILILLELVGTGIRIVLLVVGQMAIVLEDVVMVIVLITASMLVVVDVEEFVITVLETVMVHAIVTVTVYNLLFHTNNKDSSLLREELFLDFYIFSQTNSMNNSVHI